MSRYTILLERECRWKKRQQRGCENCGRLKRDPAHFGAPPSLNVLGSGNRNVYASLKKSWGAVIAAALRKSSLPNVPHARIVAEGVVCFGDRRARDQGNYRFLLEKVLGDVLVEEGYLADDTWDQYEFGHLALERDPGRSYTQIDLLVTPDVTPMSHPEGGDSHAPIQKTVDRELKLLEETADEGGV